MKMQPLDIKKLSEVIALDTSMSSEANYLSGQRLVDLFNTLGFKDDYRYGEGGIIAEGMENNPSRRQYAYKRICQLHDQHRIKELIHVLLLMVQNPNAAQEAVHKIFESVNIRNAPMENNIVEQADEIIPRKKKFHKFNVVKSQFEQIIEGHPVVFVSYAWDDDEHKTWVINFANDLRSKWSINVLLDQYNRAGLSLPHFMSKGITTADRVIVIGSPRYREKLEREETSGAIFEDSILTMEQYCGVKGKHIPVLRRGKFETAFNPMMGILTGYDFSKDEEYDDNLRKLAADLWGMPVNEAPTLGKMPTFSSAEKLNTARDPYKGEKWLERLFEYFSFNLMDDYIRRMPERFSQKVSTSFDAWNAAFCTTSFVLYDKRLGVFVKEFFSVWADITKIGLMHYAPSNNQKDYYFFDLQNDVILDSKANEDFEKIIKLMPSLSEKYKALAEYIKEYYPNIDLEKISIKFELGN